ncbi:TonB-linked outer membrane protein, SusC/RagA family [Parapedobacter composti]|uniref:TonB-linked outer membrane protein, SusC/RagA family n=1 Tax=Parapedobacter composti TaxID=623281 RepID=A0A1I1E0U3_9SPHI|nr:SusC/RagA family TonB-linked outer membrane protein [Parapedobacter composti]SFB80889.1 TonB-linked outer membrane protein, SusC/RagA family [Parapedobacter composti]
MNKRVKSIQYPLLLVFLLLAAMTAGQPSEKISVRGRVEDTDGNVIAGASVVELDKDGRTVSGTTSDMTGNFVLRVAPGHRISASIIGYQTAVQNINNRTFIVFRLNPAQTALEEVSIVAETRPKIDYGTGLQIAERDLTGAVSRVSAKDLEELSAASIDQALQGRLPGVDFGATSGDPGAGMSIRIRGTASINGSADPLIVLDGMPYEVSIPEDFNFGSADEQGYAQLLNITPADIQDITVLKDAASTAVWGARAANGVLIINTKRGQLGKPVVTYNLRGIVHQQPQAIPLLTGDQYSMLVPEMVMNANGLPLNLQNNKEFLYDPNDPYWYHNYSRNTDWIQEITQIGYTHDHNLSMTGGGQKARYYASVGYLNTVGTTKGTNLDRITTKINLDYTVSSRLRFRTDVTYAYINNRLNYTGGIRGVAYIKMPNMAVYEYDEHGLQTPVYFSPAQNIQGQYSRTYNPLAMAEQGYGRQIGQRITPRFNLQYDIIPRTLFTTFDLQFDINNTKYNSFLPQDATGRPFTETVVNLATDEENDFIAVASKLNLLYTPQLKGEHTLQSLLSIQTQDDRNLFRSARSSNTASSVLRDPAIPGRQITGALNAFGDQYRNIGVLLNAQYGFKDRYIINGSIRMDGNSRFGPENRYGYFPAVSARYRISGEPFMEKYAHWLDDLSLRGSYGQAGKAPQHNYMFYNRYANYAWSYLDEAAVFPANIELSNLRWETLVGSNIGFNLWMFKGRVRLDGELYRNRTKDLIFNNLRLPTYSGYNTATFNVGTMDNQGWELMLNTQPFRSENWSIGVDFNIARNYNVVREVSEFFPRENDARIGENGVYKTYLQIGNPFGSIYGFRYKGVYRDEEATVARDANGNPITGLDGQPVYMRFNYPFTDYVFQPGDAMYEDINHDGNIDENDMVYIGNTVPKYTGGFGFNVTYKGNLRLMTFFSYRLKYDMINGGMMNTTNMFDFDNQSTAVLKRWRNPGDETDVPRALYRSGYNWLGSDRYVEDASFVRLRSVTLRYNLTNRLLNRLGLRSAGLYATVENLFTWTRYTGQDPDISIRGNVDPFRYAQDNNLTPPTKNFLFGISAGF